MEYRDFPTNEYRLAETGNGRLTTYPSAFYCLDSYDCIMMPGCFTKHRDFFLREGFLADSHNWDFGSGVIGWPVSIEEDAYGPLVEWEFHSDPHSQMVRQKTAERKAAGKSLPQSIGFEITQYREFPRSQYDRELRAALPADKYASLIEGIQQRDSVLLVDEVKLYEGSPVAAGANPGAHGIDVRAARKTETRAQYLGEYAEAEATSSALSDLTGSLMWRVVSACCYDMNTSIADRRAMLDAGLSEYHTLMLRFFDAMPTMDADEAQVQMRELQLRFPEATQGNVVVPEVHLTIGLSAQSEFLQLRGRALSLNGYASQGAVSEGDR